ncbi:MAG: hypothetical protein IJU70_12025 [Lentisphaeria bacterium]|nr:hypothetical protein [Lentisphaeria bacterium]
MLIYYTDEQKKEFLDAIAAQGCGVEKAYKLVKEGWKAAGKRVPNINTIYNWRKTVRQASPAAPSEPAPAEAEPTAPEEAAKNSDAEYTKDLELVVRLYRTRSEKSIDAVCDRLLPDLVDWENE